MRLVAELDEVLALHWDGAPPTAAGRAMGDAATDFLKDLSPEQRSKATFKFEDDTRFEFRFTPRARTGLPLKEMSEAQRAKAHALLKTGLSVRGYATATTIIDLETVLRAARAARLNLDTAQLAASLGARGAEDIRRSLQGDKYAALRVAEALARTADLALLRVVTRGAAARAARVPARALGALARTGRNNVTAWPGRKAVVALTSFQSATRAAFRL